MFKLLKLANFELSRKVRVLKLASNLYNTLETFFATPSCTQRIRLTLNSVVFQVKVYSKLVWCHEK